MTRIHYNGEDDYSEDGIKFVVHQDGIKLKLESVDLREFPNDEVGYVTLGTFFTFSPKKEKCIALTEFYRREQHLRGSLWNIRGKL